MAVFGYIPHMSNAMAFDTLKFVKHLTAHGFSKEQAYAICSVAADLRISQAVDIPNFVVSAFLSEELFEEDD